ncbi:hypothetical protein OfM1_14810 [Lactovum odontotermitis]
MNLSQFEEKQSEERQKSQKAIDDFENELIGYQKTFEAATDSIQELMRYYELFDNSEVVNEYNHQIDLHDERLKDSRHKLAEMNEEHQQLLSKQHRDYDAFLEKLHHS